MVHAGEIHGRTLATMHFVARPVVMVQAADAPGNSARLDHEFIANPRCPYHIIGKYLGYLSSESLTKLAQGYLNNTFARKNAERLLEARGKARKPPR